MPDRFYKHQERKNELIDAAQSLFFSIGYEKASVDKIHRNIGMSKGAFYYYFESKKDILDAVLRRQVFTNLAEVNNVNSNPKADPTDKIGIFLRIMRGWKVADIPVLISFLRVFCSDGNVFLRQRNRIISTELASPVLAEIVKSGVSGSFFRVSLSDQLIDLIMRTGFEFTDTIAEKIISSTADSVNPRVLQNIIELYEDALEKILGAPGGSIRIINREFLKKLR
jgi:AcrR family transcriptional regulator